MSLRCSLFGHKYGETQRESDREQHGDELVSSVRDVKYCDRCGTQLVLSENKEVTKLEAEDGFEGTESPEQASESSQTGRTSGGQTGGDGGADGAGAVNAMAERAGVTEEGSDDLRGGTDDGTQEIPQAEDRFSTDDDDGGPPPRTDDAVILDEDGEEHQPESLGEGGVGDESVEEWEPETEPEEIEQAESTADEGLTVPEGEFRCPECGFVTAVEGSSLRAGDFCPECHVGVLEHRSG